MDPSAYHNAHLPLPYTNTHTPTLSWDVHPTPHTPQLVKYPPVLRGKPLIRYKYINYISNIVLTYLTFKI
jgi:hypothetical protein